MSGAEWGEVHRQPDLPLHAGATDVIQNAPVKIVAGGVKIVQVVQSSADHPIGIARASAPAGYPVAVRDRSEVVRVQAGATVAAGAYVGVASVTATAGASGNIQVPILGEVAKASGSVVWAVGIALEPANPGQIFSFLVEPTQLSGLA